MIRTTAGVRLCLGPRLPVTVPRAGASLVKIRIWILPPPISHTHSILHIQNVSVTEPRRKKQRKGPKMPWFLSVVYENFTTIHNHALVSTDLTYRRKRPDPISPTSTVVIYSPPPFSSSPPWLHLSSITPVGEKKIPPNSHRRNSATVAVTFRLCIPGFDQYSLLQPMNSPHGAY